MQGFPLCSCRSRLAFPRGEHCQSSDPIYFLPQMTVYDTAGIERHMSTIPQTYFRWSKVIMLVYSIDDSDTFDSLTNWADNAISARAGRSQSEIITVLVGNKVDLDNERKVSKTRAQQVSNGLLPRLFGSHVCVKVEYKMFFPWKHCTIHVV